MPTRPKPQSARRTGFDLDECRVSLKSRDLAHHASAKPACRNWISPTTLPPCRSGVFAVVCRKEGSYILYNYSGGFSWYLFRPDNRLQYDIAGTLGTGTWGYIVGRHL
jgi:hypothetical protein